MISPHNDSHIMKRRSALLGVAVALATMACASTSPTIDAGTDFGNFAGAKVEIAAEGGFAALSVMHRVDHDTRTFAFSQRRICGATCAAPMDTTDGVLSPAKTDSLFNIVLQNARALTKDDYGITKNGADMMAYAIRITAEGRTRTIRGDDGSLPDAARQIVAAIRQTISAAR
jgi:hypothetical protein